MPARGAQQQHNSRLVNGWRLDAGVGAQTRTNALDAQLTLPSLIWPASKCETPPVALPGSIEAEKKKTKRGCIVPIRESLISLSRASAPFIVGERRECDGQEEGSLRPTIVYF